MSVARSLATLIAQGLTGRDVQILGATVLCAEPGSATAGLRVKVGRTAWPAPVLDDALAVAHAAIERSARLILVSGQDIGWISRAVGTLRLATELPIAVVDVELGGDVELMLLSAGASIVIGRDVSPREFGARLIALVRARSGDESLRVRWLQAGALAVDVATRDCTLDGEALALSRHEFEILAMLMSDGGRTVRHEALVRQLGDWADEDGGNALRLSMGRLRKKLGDSPSHPQWIATVRGVGYRFLPPVSEVGDNRSEDRMRQSLARLTSQSDALGALADALAAAASVGVAQVADTVVSWSVTRGLADASTVFRLEEDSPAGARASLVASAGMSTRWRQAIATGHPVSSAFIGSHVYRSGQTMQLSDMSKLANRFPVTAQMSSAEDLHACVLFPLHVDGRIWGDLAFLSRSPQAFGPTLSSYFRTVATIVSLAVGACHEVEVESYA